MRRIILSVLCVLAFIVILAGLYWGSVYVLAEMGIPIPAIILKGAMILLVLLFLIWLVRGGPPATWWGPPGP